MKVYAAVFNGYEGDEVGPMCATREIAEAAAEQWRASTDRNNTVGSERITVEEYDVLERVPQMVTLHFAQRYARSPQEITVGTSDFWDYEIDSLSQSPYVAWARTEEEARAALLPVEMDSTVIRDNSDGHDRAKSVKPSTKENESGI